MVMSQDGCHIPDQRVLHFRGRFVKHFVIPQDEDAICMYIIIVIAAFLPRPDQ